MSWKTMYESGQLTSIVNDVLESNSGGYHPRYVTLQWNPNELAEVIQALQLAQEALNTEDTP